MIAYPFWEMHGCYMREARSKMHLSGWCSSSLDCCCSAVRVLSAGGKPAHFGLTGMRERATRLGGHLQVWSKPGAGTEVELRVPASVAYRAMQS